LNINFNELDGKRFYYSFLAVAQKIFDHYQGLNKINVFPVADGDTGTNLASTMHSIIDTAMYYATEMEQITGQKPKFISPASPVIGSHVGPGVSGLAVLCE